MFLLPVNTGEPVVHVYPVGVQLENVLVVGDGTIQLARILIIKSRAEIGCRTDRRVFHLGGEEIFNISFVRDAKILAVTRSVVEPGIARECRPSIELLIELLANRSSEKNLYKGILALRRSVVKIKTGQGRIGRTPHRSFRAATRIHRRQSQFAIAMSNDEVRGCIPPR